MEPSKEAIAVRISRLNRQILGKVTAGTSKFNKRTIDREALLDALTVLYDECNDDPVKKCDDLVRSFVDKYRSTLAELRRIRVCISDFEILQTIGRGHFGDVHMVREKETCDVYALKCVRKEQARRRAAGAAEDERDVLAHAAGPWAPKLQYAFQDNSNLYLVMELCSGGDLAGLVARRHHPLAERDAAFYVAETAHALRALHQLGFVHRDVKPHNILLDRCGHVKLGDFGSCARLSDGGAAHAPVGTPDYVAPELLAAADCAARHAVCAECCRGIVHTAVSACDYWSLGVVAFELVTLRRPFSSDDDDSISHILSNIQKYERSADAEPPFPPAPDGPSDDWRALVAGLLRVQPSRRFNYLDTLQHASLAHLSVHSIRDQAPPWVPPVRGPEDASHFSPPPRAPPPPSAAPFRARPPFAGQLPFIGYSYVAPDDKDETSSTMSFSSSHDCTAIDLATFKSAEKLVAMRGREIASLQSKLAAAETAAGAAAERARRAADDDAERTRAKLQAEITALSLQNKRLERQIEIEKEERMALERTNQELTSAASERNSAELRAARTQASDLASERDGLRDGVARLEARVSEMQLECARATAAADAAMAQHKHYKEILEHAQELRHRTLTEINVRAIDSIAKERALRRQTLSGGEAETREAGARAAAAEAGAAREARAREQAERRLAGAEADCRALRADLDNARRQLATAQESLGEKQRVAVASTDQLKEAQLQLTQERVRASSLAAQVQELQRCVQDAAQREAALEEQCARTEARFNERLEVAEARAAAALSDDARHRDKVNTLEQLVRQLEREVTALESRSCAACEARASPATTPGGSPHKAHSDTESTGDAHAHAHVLREQLERAETQLQTRAEEIAALRQEARTANLARWRKEREYNDLSVEAKTAARDLKRAEERLTSVTEARRAADRRVAELQSELEALKPQHELVCKDAERIKEQLENLQKQHATAQAEVDRSRNDIRKLKSELQYSERRRMHAEEQEELGSRERVQLRDELTETRAHNAELVQNNKALQEACGLLEEQLIDLEKLSDIHEVKNKDLESEVVRMRSELSAVAERLGEAERAAVARAAAAALASTHCGAARDQARHSAAQLQRLRERLEGRESRVAELESRVASLEGERSAAEAALGSAARRVRDLQEECAALRTRAHDHHALALQLQAQLAEAQEEICGAREAAEAAAAWWRTRETKADATLRQQAKLIDFLQAKLEEAGRKKCSLGNKLFGRSGRRAAASPPLRRANRELREEVDRLRAKLGPSNAINAPSYPPTPRREKSKPNNQSNGVQSIDSPDGTQEYLQIVWRDGTRERMRARASEGALQLTGGGRELRAQLLAPDAAGLPHNEASRAFAIKVEKMPGAAGTAGAVCADMAARAQWLARLARGGGPAPPAPPAAPAPYAPRRLRAHDAAPTAAAYLADGAVAIGCELGLNSLRAAVRLEHAGAGPVRGRCAVTGVALAGPRALLVAGGALVSAGRAALESALRRAPALQPSVPVAAVALPDHVAPHLLSAMSPPGAAACAVACGRRVVVLRLEPAAGEFRAARSLAVDRAPAALLLTPGALFVAGERPLRVPLPAGALEAFAADELTVAAAAKKRSAPKAILMIKPAPLEILICYAECGIFVDEHGRRTRHEDPKWSSAVHDFEFVSPFLYALSEDKITIVNITEEAYRAPPCTCDTNSVASVASEFYMPEVFNLKINEPALLGTAPKGILVRTKRDDVYDVCVVEGAAAFKSIGASVESLDTDFDVKGSSTDLAQAQTDLSPLDVSQDSIGPQTGFLADIRKRARQLRAKNQQDHDPLQTLTPDDVIKEILTTEVGLKRMSGRRSPAVTSEFDSDSITDSDADADDKSATEICAEMFARQVRFQ